MEGFKKHCKHSIETIEKSKTNDSNDHTKENEAQQMRFIKTKINDVSYNDDYN